MVWTLSASGLVELIGRKEKIMTQLYMNWIKRVKTKFLEVNGKTLVEGLSNHSAVWWHAAAQALEVSLCSLFTEEEHCPRFLRALRKCSTMFSFLRKLHTVFSLVKWVSESHSVVSDSLWPHGLYNPCNSPDENTGVGSLSLLQGIFPTQGSNPGLPHCRPILYHLSHQGSPRILE